MTDVITVRVLKYDGTNYRSWKARKISQKDSLLVLDAKFEADVTHDLLGEIKTGTRTIEYYWRDRWYNIFQFLTDDGGVRLYYCNVNMPPALENGELTYVDLDIDILVRPNLSYQVLDLEEFEANSTRFKYPEEVVQNAVTAKDELIRLIESRQFPFGEAQQ